MTHPTPKNPSTVAGREFTHRYKMYSLDQGRPPADQLAHDKGQWPGGHMAGFTIWIAEKWSTWRNLNSVPPAAALTQHDHSAFDRWLANRYEPADQLDLFEYSNSRIGSEAA